MTENAKRMILERIDTYEKLHDSMLEQENLVEQKFWNDEDTTDEEAVLDICRRFEAAALTDAARAIYLCSRRTISMDSARTLILDHPRDELIYTLEMA